MKTEEEINALIVKYARGFIRNRHTFFDLSNRLNSAPSSTERFEKNFLIEEKNRTWGRVESCLRSLLLCRRMLKKLKKKAAVDGNYS